jgi:hypothetical protein
VTSLHLLRTQSGAFIPATEEDADLAKRFKVGSVSRVELKLMRNSAHHRKFFALVKIAFDMWTETLPEQTWRGMPVQPNIDHFRRDLIIAAGFHDVVWSTKKDTEGNQQFRVIPKSIAFANMSQPEFEQLYSAVIDVVLRMLPGRGLSEAKLREMAERVLEFA